MQVACSWSGGKDSCYALMKAREAGAVPAILVNMMNENGQISRSHGLPLSLLQQQATAMNLPIKATATSWKEYEKKFIGVLEEVKSTHHIEAVVFGDIDLQGHRDWEEMVCAKAQLKAILPIWQRNRKDLLLEMLDKGLEAMIVSCNTALGENFLGKMLNHSLIPELEAQGVDVCGENGEFHTIVVNCPLFQQPLILPSFSKIKHEEYYFIHWGVDY